jgi:5'-3' exonuclease
MRLAIIDADSIVWITAYNCQEDPSKLEETVDKFVENILKGSKADYYLGFLGSKESKATFRHKIAVTRPYKGKRKEAPEFIKELGPKVTEILVNKYNFYVVNPEIEADDACTICHSQTWVSIDGNLPEVINRELSMEELAIVTNITTILCAIDKDLQQVKGLHYNYNNHEEFYLDSDQARKKLWMQILTGDSTDNIEGIPGIGPKKAEKILERNKEYRYSVLNEYIDVFSLGEGVTKLAETFELIFMLRKEKYGFTIPKVIQYDTKRSIQGN